jgi:hypothetical protein
MACLQIFSFWLIEEHGLDKDASIDFYDFLKKLQKLPLTACKEFLDPAIESLSLLIQEE